MNEWQGGREEDTLQVVVALVHSSRLAEARLDAALAGAGLSVAKWVALKHLVQAGEPLALGQLATRLACVKSNATQLVDRLEAERLVRRAPDPNDRRSIRAELTPEGRQRYAAGLAALQAVERELLGDLTPDEQRHLADLLARLQGPVPARL